jgi:hypothetical protein
MRVTLLGEATCINRTFSSLVLNLSCKGLLLGIRGEGNKELPDDGSPRALTTIDIMAVNTSVYHFTGRRRLSKWHGSGPIGGPVGIYLGGGPKGNRDVMQEVS